MKLNYGNLLGKQASWRLQKRMLPASVWNQEVYGELLTEQFQRKPQTRWLDAGCGCRILAQGLEPLEDLAVARAGFAVGMDPDKNGVGSHRNIETRACGFLDALPFSDQSFDVVSCNMVVEHLGDPLKCFAEIKRVLAPGGIVIFHTPNLRNYMVFLNHTVGRVLPRSFVLRIIQAGEGRSAEEVFPTFYRMNSAKQVHKMAAALGFTVESQKFLPPPRPFFNFFLPLAFLQMLLTRVLASLGLERYESTMLVTLRKA
jgi:2-polyprenyl-3-methyl-5-hydroxy-6-metoxy-1,4-benzoquinol methylase